MNARESKGKEEKANNKNAKGGSSEDVEKGFEIKTSVGGAGSALKIDCFAKKASSGESGKKGKGGSKVGRDGEAEAGEKAADRGTEHKAETKGGAQQAHSFGTGILVGNVGDVGLGNADIATRDSVNNSGEEESRERVG